MLQEYYDKLKPYFIPKRKIDIVYCNPMIRRRACPLSANSDCSTCLPTLQGAVTNLDGANDSEHEYRIVLWRLKKIGSGEACIWVNDEKESIKTNHFGQGENLFVRLLESLEENL